MKLLIVAATEAEIAPLVNYLDKYVPLTTGKFVDVLITGVGMVATTYALTRHLQAATYDLVLQAGVGGSFDEGIHLGSLVFVTSERYGDLGAEDHDDHLDIFDMGLLPKDDHPFSGSLLPAPMLPVHNKIKLPRVKGLTVNTVSGSEKTIKRLKETYICDTESMEGAAFHYVCLQEQVPFAQVRAISNYVTPRDRSSWRMNEAIMNLNNWLIEFIETL